MIFLRRRLQAVNFLAQCNANRSIFTTAIRYNYSYLVLLGNPKDSVKHKEAIEKYREGVLASYVNEKFDEKIKKTGALIGANQRKKEVKYWQDSIRLYVEDKLLDQYAKEHNLSFSPNVFDRREQRREILDKVASWRVKPKSALEKSIEAQDKHNKEIIESTRGSSYKTSNAIMKQQIHTLLLRTLHKAQLKSEIPSNGWSLRNAHKRFPKDLLLNPYPYFQFLGYKLENYPSWSVETNVDRVSKFGEVKLRRMLAEMIESPPKLTWDPAWRLHKGQTELPEMESVMGSKPHKVAWRNTSPYPREQREALARRAKQHGFCFDDIPKRKKPDTVLQKHKQKGYEEHF